jgi:hypothetical protein
VVGARISGLPQIGIFECGSGRRDDIDQHTRRGQQLCPIADLSIPVAVTGRPCIVRERDRKTVTVVWQPATRA